MARPRKCPVCGRGNPPELTQCQWCKAEIGPIDTDGVMVGTYADGRPVHLSASTGRLDVGGTPVELETMRAYDAVAQVSWLSDDARRASLRAYDMSPLSPAEWIAFTIAFLVLAALSWLIGTGLHLAWRRSRPVQARQILVLGWAVFAIAVVVNLVLNFTDVLPRM